MDELWIVPGQRGNGVHWVSCIPPERNVGNLKMERRRNKFFGVYLAARHHHPHSPCVCVCVLMGSLYPLRVINTYTGGSDDCLYPQTSIGNAHSPRLFHQKKKKK